MSNEEDNTSSPPRDWRRAVRVTLTSLLTGVLIWLVAGTEWAVFLDQEKFLESLEVSAALDEKGERCSITVNVGALTPAPSSVSLDTGSVYEPLELKDGAATFPIAKGTSTTIRITYLGVLRKPTHVNISFLTNACSIGGKSLQTMPLMPF